MNAVVSSGAEFEAGSHTGLVDLASVAAVPEPETYAMLARQSRLFRPHGQTEERHVNVSVPDNTPFRRGFCLPPGGKLSINRQIECNCDWRLLADCSVPDPGRKIPVTGPSRATLRLSKRLAASWR